MLGSSGQAWVAPHRTGSTQSHSRSSMRGQSACAKGLFQACFGSRSRLVENLDMAQLEQKRPKREHSSFASFAAFLWVVAAIGLAVVTCDVHSRSHRIYAQLELPAPGIVEGALQAGAFIRSDIGFVLACGAGLLSLLPFLFGARGRGIAISYLLAALLAAGTATLIWFSNAHALQLLAEKMASQAGR